MKRLVYSPSINAWIKTDTGIFDLSPYITDCTIDRRINSVSYARLTFRNPKIEDKKSGKSRFMFTEHIGADGNLRSMFHPMDPIIITMTRLKGRPIQVFTGYCDTTPYVQVYPGIAQLEASCTLKRLQYTYWDPALPFVRQWMEKYGWGISKDGIALNPTAEGNRDDRLNDTSIGFLLYHVLQEIGGWNKDNIYIQELPGDKIVKIVAKLYEDTAKENADSIKEFHKFLYDILGASSYGTAGVVTPGVGGPSAGSDGQPLGGGTELPDPPQEFKNRHPELKSGILQVLYAVLKEFPALSVTSTTGGGHATNSYHYKGRAVDIAGSTAVMGSAANWIRANVGKNLTEGIYNPSLSVKNQQSIPNNFWGEATWNNHIDHIHLAV